jgi:D-amino peptidase
VKVYISVDMEGITGISSLKQISSTAPEWGLARLWMTEDVNAAVAGALEGGASEVVVRDAHGPAINILPDRLHPAARLVTGWSPFLDMLQCLDASFAVAFFVGYHPGPPAAGGVLSHTYSMALIREVTINGVSAGESLINALQAGVFGVPVGLVTGEKGLRDEIAPVLDSALFVQTKTGFGWQSAMLKPMAECREQIRVAASAAVKRCLQGVGFPVYRPELPVQARLDYHRAEACLASRLVPGVETIDTRSIWLTADTAEEWVRRFQLLSQVLYGMEK